MCKICSKLTIKIHDIIDVLHSPTQMLSKDISQPFKKVFSKKFFLATDSY